MIGKTGITIALILGIALMGAGHGSASQAHSSSKLPLPIPAGAGNLVVGPLATKAFGSNIDNVVLNVDMRHDAVRDLAITLHYDQDRDGQYDSSARVVLVLPEYDTLSASTVWACPFVLDGVYRFELPSPMQVEDFQGARSGGEFYLEITDYESESQGSLAGWDVEVEYSDESLADPRFGAAYGKKPTGKPNQQCFGSF